MEPEQVLNSLRRAITRRVDSLSISVTSGGVDNMETYKVYNRTDQCIGISASGNL